jgi:hypothetical protein
MIVAALLFAILRPVAFVPMDDRPVTRQLPLLLGAIAGRAIVTPPRADVGNYLSPGKPDTVLQWLNGPSASRAGAFAISTDMLVYGGLVASRIPGVTYADAYARLQEFHQLRRRHPKAWIGAFGTIMRLAPTGIPALGAAKDFFASYPTWSYLQQYANLHDPLLPSEVARAAQLRALIGDATLQQYLDTRTRDYQVDATVLQIAASGAIDRVVLGQDDAGPVGLHVKETRTLQDLATRLQLGPRASIEPGADELGMAVVSQALARGAGWTPHISVAYSTPSGAAFNDPLEYAPIENAINALIALSGGVRDDSAPDISLYVRVPDTTAVQDDELFARMQSDIRSGKRVAFSDISFLSGSFAPQAAFTERLIAGGLAARLDAYSSWNTNANTVGTALAEAVAAGAGRRTHTYSALAHAEFTFDRIVDDYAFHDFVRPDLNRYLDAHAVSDHTYLLRDVALDVSQRNDAELWNRAQSLLGQIYPQYHIAAMHITLPWDRTFETEIEAALAPNL